MKGVIQIKTDWLFEEMGGYSTCNASGMSISAALVMGDDQRSGQALVVVINSPDHT